MFELSLIIFVDFEGLNVIGGSQFPCLKHVVKRIPSELGFDKNSFNIVNGSGFSRENKFAAKQCVEILDQTSKEFDLGPEFFVSLGVPGENGTLTRFKNTPLFQRLRAKTGSLNGVLALSGFLLPDDKKPVVFSILLNHKNKEDTHLHETLDEILLHLSKL